MNYEYIWIGDAVDDAVVEDPPKRPRTLIRSPTEPETNDGPLGLTRIEPLPPTHRFSSNAFGREFLFNHYQ